MRYLVISDIHGNLEALEAVLADAPAHDAVICLGDLVGYGPSPNDVVDTLREVDRSVVLAGDHDWAAIGRVGHATFNTYASFALDWTAGSLGTDEKEFLGSLPVRAELQELTLVHGSPRDPVWEYLDDAAHVSPCFDAFDTQLCLVGHTHVPLVITQQEEGPALRRPAPGETVLLRGEQRLILNPGSVGQPRDDDPRAAYGLYDATRGTFEFRRVPYDVDSTQRKMQAAGLPWPLAIRLAVGL